MANTTFYNRGDAYHDSAGNPAIIKKGNELTFTEHFNAGGGGELPVASASTLGGVKIGEGVNINENGVISVSNYTPPAYSAIEVDTGATWINGEKIYRRVIDYTGALSNTAVTLASNIDYIGNIIHADCVSDTVGEGYSPIVAWLDGTNLKGRTAGNYASQLLHIVIDYIKPAEQTNTRTVKKAVKKG